MRKIVESVKSIPSLDSGTLMDFASQLENAVFAVKSLGNAGYLFSPEFTDEILGRLPKSMLHDYARYAVEVGNKNTPLENIAKFVNLKAETAARAGIISFQGRSISNTSSNSRDRVRHSQ